MSGDNLTTAPPPPVMWAQRKSSVLLTICLEDCTKPDIKILNDSIFFKGTGGTDKKEYEVTINLYKPIDPAKSVYSIRDRLIEFILQKKEEGPFWPHLTKEKVKYHWLKVDFNKWQDEDSDGDVDPFSSGFPDLQTMMKMGEGGGSGDNKTNFNDIDLESDSDDGDLPDLE